MPSSGPRSVTRLVTPALLCLALVACNDSSSEPLEDPSLDAIAEVVADGALEDLGFMREAIPSSPLQTPSEAPASVPGQGSEHTRTVSFFDEFGDPMDAYDAQLTAQIRWTHEFTVTMGRGRVTGEMTRSREMTVSGLLGTETERTHNGLGLDERSRIQVNEVQGTRTYDMSAEVTIEDVVIAVDRVTQPWPLSGTITRVVTIEIGNAPQGGDITRTRTTVLTFDGTQFPTLTIDGESFEVDLATPPGYGATRRLGR